MHTRNLKSCTCGTENPRWIDGTHRAEIEAERGTTLILNGIPAKLCANCGEAVMSMETALQLPGIVEPLRIRGLGTITRHWDDVTGR